MNKDDSGFYIAEKSLIGIKITGFDISLSDKKEVTENLDSFTGYFFHPAMN
jgi:hypothetical protein